VLTSDVREDANRPADALGAGVEIEGVEPSERIGDVERPRRVLDRTRARDPVPVELRACGSELAEVARPEDVAVLRQRVHAPVHRRVLGDARRLHSPEWTRSRSHAACRHPTAYRSRSSPTAPARSCNATASPSSRTGPQAVTRRFGNGLPNATA